ncbi:MAG: ethanolamine ammonia-lyase reactivating factor EutA [Xanthobacteraceae bacterium]|nr:ethanolamine ammonia-lyase reactivating factor EutA [Xanthobacteraceae bacterium]
MTADSPKPHSLSDHRLGLDLDHVHDGFADHDHDFPDEGPLEENPIWLQDRVTLTSVGIDIGSSGTQVIFSRVHMRRLGEDLSSRYYVASRETLFASPVALTPYESEHRIDEAALSTIIDSAYVAAGLASADIDTGVVILTGEALRRENAELIAGVIAGRGGDLVCASAGHHMEAMLAAYGSGSAAVSHDRHQRILNIDIGGGTTKLAVAQDGRVIATAALDIGGRLLVVDDAGRITRLDPAGRLHAERAGLDWQRGDVIAPADLDKVVAVMTDALVVAITQRPLPSEVANLFLTDPIDIGTIDGVMFSGGVAEYVYERETRDFGDLGRRLGHAVAGRVANNRLPWPLLPAGECIRATALGASEYSVQLSGSTSFISDPGSLLPRRNLKVLRPDYRCSDEIDAGALASAIHAHVLAFDAAEEDVALALSWRGVPSHARLAAFADGIGRGLAGHIAAGRPLFLMLDGDVAQTLGAILRDERAIKNELLVIDGVVLWDFDYIDLGRIRLPSNTVPVTIKSLVFNQDPRRPHVHSHPHSHADHRDMHQHHHHD